MTTSTLPSKTKIQAKTISESIPASKSAKKEIFFSTEDRPGTLIIVEGSDGSGKSTQLLIAKNLLESN
jgi:ABC-type lipoprotein export system ATPase subunit